MRLVLLGIQGAGKGTQAEKLAQHFGVPHIDVGDLLRHRATQDDVVGKKIQALIDSGSLIPDKITNKIVSEALADKTGWVLDGYPRDVAEAEYLDEVVDIETVMFLTISDAVAVERLSKRRICEKCHGISDSSKKKCTVCGGKLVQREDDTPAAIKKRLAVFHDVTEPLTEYYRVRGILHEVDASGKPEAVLKSILSILE